MTGTGTQTDPYVVDNWEDFVTAIGTENAYVSVPTGTAFDMNKILPEGLSALTIKCTELDGNGLILRCIYINRGSTNTYGLTFNGTVAVKNVKFLDMYLLNTSSSTTYFFHGCSSTTFYNCTFSVIINSISDDMATLTDSADFYNCSMYVIFKGYANGIGYSASASIINNCNIYIDASMSTFYGTTGTYYTLQNSKISGIPHRYFHIYGDVYTSVLDLNVESEKYLKYTGDYADGILINADKVADDVTIPSTMMAVTTGQMTDTAYLESIGFPIGTEAT